MPKQPALGFFAFVACAPIAMFSALQQQSPGLSHAKLDAAAAATVGVPGTGVIASDLREPLAPAETQMTEGVKHGSQPKRGNAGAEGRVGVVIFESRSIATTEKALAAVFIVERPQSAEGKVRVNWAAYSGSADAGIDFSDASGTARFADGQRQLAIYVPLRNDLLR